LIPADSIGRNRGCGTDGRVPRRLAYIDKDMTEIEPLILDLLEWLHKEPRRYLEVMDAWRTSCPRKVRRART
jgi:hypothetical protein